MLHRSPIHSIVFSASYTQCTPSMLDRDQEASADSFYRSCASSKLSRKGSMALDSGVIANDAVGLMSQEGLMVEVGRLMTRTDLSRKGLIGTTSFDFDPNTRILHLVSTRTIIV
jgi:hypothetical protein